MPKNKQQKKEIIDSLNDKIKKSKSVIFAGFDALEVKDNESLRNQLRQENNEYYVAKKTLITRALQDNKLDINVRNFDGKVATIFSYEDEVSPAKIIGSFRKKEGIKDKVFFLGGILEGKLLSKEEVETLANIPGKSELYAKIVGSLNSPISGFVNALAGNIRNLVNVLKAIEDKK